MKTLFSPADVFDVQLVQQKMAGAATEVGIHRMHVEREFFDRGFLAEFLHQHHRVLLHEVVPVLLGSRQEGRRTRGARGADNVERGAVIQGNQPVVQRMAIRSVKAGKIDRRQLAQPSGQLDELTFIEQRYRVGLVHRVVKQQRHDVVERFYFCHAFIVSKLLDHLNGFTQLLETVFQRGKLNLLTLLFGLGHDARQRMAVIAHRVVAK